MGCTYAVGGLLLVGAAQNGNRFNHAFDANGRATTVAAGGIVNDPMLLGVAVRAGSNELF